MHETIRATIKGVVPTILCNGQAADPLNPFCKDLKKISSKKNKTEDDHRALAKTEFFSCMYVDEKDQPCWPSDNIESMIIKAAAKQRKGTDAKAGVFVDGHAPIIYEGPKTPKGLWSYKKMENNPFVLRSLVSVNRSRVVRTRPIFRDWSLKFDVHYLTDMFDKEQVIHIIETAGRVIGLSDWRPKYGRFQLVDVESVTYEREK
jgi:hypothetical protein